MVSKMALIQILTGIFGFFSTLGMFWVGKIYKWNDELSMVASLLVAVGTILIELSISFNNLKDSIEKLYPVLELSAEEQKNIHSSILMNSELQKIKDMPHAKIALEEYKEAIETLRAATEGNDFYTDDIFQANFLALESMQPGQTFKGLSALINPDYWYYDPAMEKYKDLNFSQAQRGIIIKRIFLFNNSEELEQMNQIMVEQLDNKIQVYYCFQKDIKHINHFPDFTSIKDLNFAIIVPRLEKLQTVTITQSKYAIAEVESQFGKILKCAKKFEGAKNDGQKSDNS